MKPTIKTNRSDDFNISLIFNVVFVAFIFFSMEVISKSALISSNPWLMYDTVVYDFSNNSKNIIKTYEFKTKNILDKINSLYRNLNTLSFLDIIQDYKKLNE